jgi:hypothetical protein
MEFMSGNLLGMEMLKDGLIAGAVIALLSAVLILLTGHYLNDQSAALTAVEGNGYPVTTEWIVRWAAISLVFGVVAAYAYNFATVNFAWNSTHYFIVAAAMVIILDVLAFVPIYDGKIAPYAYEWLGLNAVFGIGVGLLIPFLAGN